MFVSVLRMLGCCVVLFLISGCASTPSPMGKPVASMTFKHLQPIPLTIHTIDIQTVETNNMAGFSYDLDQMVQAYLDRKFVAGGGEGTLLASLDSSSIKRGFEESSNAAADLFGLGGYDVYEAALSLRLEHLDKGLNRVYGTVVRAKRIIKISEHASIAEREYAQFEGLEHLFVELDRHVEKVVLKDMALGQRR